MPAIMSLGDSGRLNFSLGLVGVERSIAYSASASDSLKYSVLPRKVITPGVEIFVGSASPLKNMPLLLLNTGGPLQTNAQSSRRDATLTATRPPLLVRT